MEKDGLILMICLKSKQKLSQIMMILRLRRKV